jgi:hypothetical protein
VTRQNERSNPREQSGQVILEYILLLVVALSVSFILQRFLRDRQIAATLTVRPWASLDGMIQCGVWRPDCGIGKQAGSTHPTSGGRVLTHDPEDF